MDASTLNASTIRRVDSSIEALTDGEVLRCRMSLNMLNASAADIRRRLRTLVLRAMTDATERERLVQRHTVESTLAILDVVTPADVKPHGCSVDIDHRSALDVLSMARRDVQVHDVLVLRVMVRAGHTATLVALGASSKSNILDIIDTRLVMTGTRWSVTQCLSPPQTAAHPTVSAAVMHAFVAKPDKAVALDKRVAQEARVRDSLAVYTRDLRIFFTVDDNHYQARCIFDYELERCFTMWSNGMTLMYMNDTFDGDGMSSVFKELSKLVPTHSIHEWDHIVDAFARPVTNALALSKCFLHAFVDAANGAVCAWINVHITNARREKKRKETRKKCKKQSRVEESDDEESGSDDGGDKDYEPEKNDDDGGDSSTDDDDHDDEENDCDDDEVTRRSQESAPLHANSANPSLKTNHKSCAARTDESTVTCVSIHEVHCWGKGFVTAPSGDDERVCVVLTAPKKSGDVCWLDIQSMDHAESIAQPRAVAVKYVESEDLQLIDRAQSFTSQSAQSVHLQQAPRSCEDADDLFDAPLVGTGRSEMPSPADDDLQELAQSYFDEIQTITFDSLVEEFGEENLLAAMTDDEPSLVNASYGLMYDRDVHESIMCNDVMGVFDARTTDGVLRRFEITHDRTLRLAKAPYDKKMHIASFGTASGQILKISDVQASEIGTKTRQIAPSVLPPKAESAVVTIAVSNARSVSSTGVCETSFEDLVAIQPAISKLNQHIFLSTALVEGKYKDSDLPTRAKPSASSNQTAREKDGGCVGDQLGVYEENKVSKKSTGQNLFIKWTNHRLKSKHIKPNQQRLGTFGDVRTANAVCNWLLTLPPWVWRVPGIGRTLVDRAMTSFGTTDADTRLHTVAFRILTELSGDASVAASQTFLPIGVKRKRSSGLAKAVDLPLAGVPETQPKRGDSVDRGVTEAMRATSPAVAVDKRRMTKKEGKRPVESSSSDNATWDHLMPDPVPPQSTATLADETQVEDTRSSVSAQEFFDMGFNVTELIDSFSPRVLEDAGYELSDIIANGMSVKKMIEEGYTSTDVATRGGLPLRDAKDMGFP